MLAAWWLCVVAVSLSATALSALDPEQEVRVVDPEQEARQYLELLDKEYGRRANVETLAEWGYASNITDETLQYKLNVSAEHAKFQKQQWLETIKYPWHTYKDPDIRRQFQKYSVLGTAALSEEKFDKLEKLVSEMESIYSTAKVCDYNDATKCDLSLEPELTERLAESRDPKELSHIWVEWRHASGEKVRSQFEHYVALSNEAAVLNNFTDASAYWLKDYEAEDFQDQVKALWDQVKPLYQQLHAYVRRRLNEKYGDDVVNRRGPIPAHLLGNMWAQTWNNIFDISVPFPGKQNIDVTEEMVKQGYTPLRMFKLSEEFFVSLNLSAMPETFWKNSILEKPEGRELICHASAWDFYDSKDFRIKQCTAVNMEDLFTAHHEMGHIQYFLQYKDQPFIYKEGANPGFHEAVGDVMALSVSTPKHLRKVGLLDGASTDDPEATINYLYLQGLQKIVFLPFAYVVDLWRWAVFQGEITSDAYNCNWWKLRGQYQGIEPPVDRTEEDFDPGSKYHVIASVPYIRYFVSFIIQFQFHRALCIEAGEYDPQDESKPLHECDIYQSTKAGNLLSKMLQMGSSKPWPDAMEVVTGQRLMDASGLLEYFRPLHKWLEQENAKTSEYIGWDPTDKHCVQTRVELEKLKAQPVEKEDSE
ncbi:angiotensin-converting enzyme-like isoform X1 [Schistocerca piceifrons]|uniref:Angiotensin-converting enzyme n=3 Tax=Schistocerca gregaria TaxID=7010 RepID=A0A8E5JTD8_SCHGR|nr:angiotensin-converting enzyme-like isoform X1 [Schistocerca piceifrons]XP_049842413.1 angiotensin-converting enzyme-like isoform X3 [Schistocerca gregaria]XP_049842416.1 angiotensin-converting enzyme-like isoform X3 [Schistocerca gregaria]XP_049946293.1 angiotensin-converting enzyme-like isoform X1 [Schistocerca serialis cubense]QVD39552.1 Angiotensin-converting enzyme [Schistocerca gregaria]